MMAKKLVVLPAMLTPAVPAMAQEEDQRQYAPEAQQRQSGEPRVGDEFSGFGVIESLEGIPGGYGLATSAGEAIYLQDGTTPGGTTTMGETTMCGTTGLAEERYGDGGTPEQVGIDVNEDDTDGEFAVQTSDEGVSATPDEGALPGTGGMVLPLAGLAGAVPLVGGLLYKRKSVN